MERTQGCASGDGLLITSVDVTRAAGHTKCVCMIDNDAGVHTTSCGSLVYSAGLRSGRQAILCVLQRQVLRKVTIAGDLGRRGWCRRFQIHGAAPERREQEEYPRSESGAWRCQCRCRVGAISGQFHVHLSHGGCTASATRGLRSLCVVACPPRADGPRAYATQGRFSMDVSSCTFI